MIGPALLFVTVISHFGSFIVIFVFIFIFARRFFTGGIAVNDSGGRQERVTAWVACRAALSPGRSARRPGRPGSWLAAFDQWADAIRPYHAIGLRFGIARDHRGEPANANPC